MKAKIAEAIKYGVPVVATSVAIESMHLRHGTDVLIGDTPVVFAVELVQLYTDCELWNHLTVEGYRNIQNHYSPQVAKLQLLRALLDAGLTPRKANARHHC